MKINYHFHSGVSVESGGDLYIFDYYRKGFDPCELALFKNVYVFASHNHGDHFDRSILGWNQYKGDINYIFSHDISNFDVPASVMNPGDVLKINDIKVTALDSTDEGVAFLVNTPELTLFHAGDLNWWHWEGESEEYNLGMKEKYKREINKLRGEHIDVAFIPVDKRLEDSMYYSIDYLMATADVKTVCPLHFWGDWKYIEKVKDELKNREYYNRIYFYGR